MDLTHTVIHSGFQLPYQLLQSLYGPAYQSGYTKPEPQITKAVIVCIQYFNTRGEVPAHNAHGIATFIQEVYGCSRENIIILNDRFSLPASRPTRHIILQSLLWLFRKSKFGDRLLFYCCGMFRILDVRYAN
jgi:hypothetical protein